MMSLVGTVACCQHLCGLRGCRGELQQYAPYGSEMAMIECWVETKMRAREPPQIPAMRGDCAAPLWLRLSHLSVWEYL